MDNSGYGTGKTFGIAVVKALRAILLPNRVQMMISHTFGGVKLLFDTYLEPWFYEFPRYADQFAIGTKNPVSKTSELYSVKLANGNSIRGVPPGILTGSTRLRSERCNDISLDEWAHYHSQEEIDTVIKSRAIRYNPYHKFKAKTSNEIRLKNILSNHKCFLSTPNYKFHPSFKRARFFVQKAHVDKSPNYGFETYSYLDLMDNEEFMSQKNRLLGDQRKARNYLEAIEKKGNDSRDLAEKAFDFLNQAEEEYVKGDYITRKKILNALGTEFVLKEKTIQIKFLDIFEYFRENQKDIYDLSLEKRLEPSESEGVSPKSEGLEKRLEVIKNTGLEPSKNTAISPKNVPDFDSCNSWRKGCPP